MTLTDGGARVDAETQVLIEEARRRQRSRHRWIGIVFVATLTLGLGLFFVVASGRSRAVPVSGVRQDGPVLPGKTSWWLFFQTQDPGVGFGISAYKTGTPNVHALSLPSSVDVTATVTIDCHKLPSLTQFHTFTLW